MKKRNIFILIFGIVLVLCHIYTNTRMAYYKAHPNEKYYAGINYTAANVNLSSCDPGVYCFISVFAYNENTVSAGHATGLDSDRKEICLTDIEQCILRDYFKYFIKPMKSDETASKTDKKMYIKCIYWNYDREGRMLNVGSIDRTPDKALQIHIFAYIALTFFYMRSFFPIIIFFYMLFALLLYKNAGAVKNTPLWKFTAVMFAALIVFDVLFSHSRLYSALYAFGLHNPLTFGDGGMHLGGMNIRIDISVIIAEAIGVYALFKENRVKTAAFYLMPSVLLTLAECAYFGVFNNGIYFAQHINAQYLFVDPKMPYFRLLYFTAVFAAGLMLYLLFGLIAERNGKRRFCFAVSFAAINALHICLASWLLVYGWGVLY